MWLLFYDYYKSRKFVLWYTAIRTWQKIAIRFVRNDKLVRTIEPFLTAGLTNRCVCFIISIKAINHLTELRQNHVYN